jgi:hypothetical protein
VAEASATKALSRKRERQIILKSALLGLARPIESTNECRNLEDLSFASIFG